MIKYSEQFITNSKNQKAYIGSIIKVDCIENCYLFTSNNKLEIRRFYENEMNVLDTNKNTVITLPYIYIKDFNIISNS